MLSKNSSVQSRWNSDLKKEILILKHVKKKAKEKNAYPHKCYDRRCMMSQESLIENLTLSGDQGKFS